MACYNQENYILDYMGIFCLDSETIHKMGVLKSTHEIQLYIDISEDNKIIFIGAWEVAYGSSWEYKQDELLEFEKDHEGLLTDIQEKFDKGNVSFRYITKDNQNGFKQHFTNDIKVIRALQEESNEKGEQR